MVIAVVAAIKHTGGINTNLPTINLDKSIIVVSAVEAAICQSLVLVILLNSEGEKEAE